MRSFPVFALFFLFSLFSGIAFSASTSAAQQTQVCSTVSNDIGQSLFVSFVEYDVDFTSATVTTVSATRSNYSSWTRPSGERYTNSSFTWRVHTELCIFNQPGPCQDFGEETGTDGEIFAFRDSVQFIGGGYYVFAHLTSAPGNRQVWRFDSTPYGSREFSFRNEDYRNGSASMFTDDGLSFVDGFSYFTKHVAVNEFRYECPDGSGGKG